MFCGKCGREIPEESVFCPHCGLRAFTQPAYERPAAGFPENTKAYVSSFFGMLRRYTVSLFRSGPSPLSDEAAGFEWIPIVVLNILLFSLALTVNLKQSFDTDGLISFRVPFGKTFAGNLLIALCWEVFQLGLFWADVKLIRRSENSFNVIINRLTVAAWPLIPILLLNLIWGFIGLVPPVFLFLVSLLAVMVARTDIHRGLCGMEKTHIIDIAVINGITLLAAILAGYGLYKDIIQSVARYIYY